MSDEPDPAGIITEDAPAERDGNLSLDVVLELLSNRRRRYVLYALSQAQDEALNLEELFDEVVTLIAAVDETGVTYDGYADVAADIYHWHLPTLADAGVVDCDARHRTVRYFADSRLERWIGKVRESELAAG